MTELEGYVLAKVDFDVKELALWQDHVPVSKLAADEASAGTMIQRLDLESVQKAFESDVLRLTTDLARWGDYDSKLQSTSRKAQIAKVLRLKNEGRKGSQIVVDFMQRAARFKPNKYADEHSCITEACRGIT